MVESSERGNGCYRDVEDLVIKLVEFYVNSDEYDMPTFEEPNKFQLEMVPFGKDDMASSCLVSIFNIGKDILSSNENYLLFGADYTENSLPVSCFTLKIISDIRHVSNTRYSVLCRGELVSVKLVVGE